MKDPARKGEPMKRYQLYISTVFCCVMISVFCVVSSASGLMITRESYAKAHEGSFVLKTIWATVETADFSNDVALTGPVGGPGYTVLSCTSSAGLDGVESLPGEISYPENIDIIPDNGSPDGYPETEPVPEPATCLLLGAGLIGIGTFSRKYRRRSA